MFNIRIANTLLFQTTFILLLPYPCQNMLFKCEGRAIYQPFWFCPKQFPPRCNYSFCFEYFYCPVHLHGRNQICPRQNSFVQDIILFPQGKNFVCNGLKIIFALGKLVSSNGKNFCPGQNHFVLGRIWFCPGQKVFFLGRWTGH